MRRRAITGTWIGGLGTRSTCSRRSWARTRCGSREILPDRTTVGTAPSIRAKRHRRLFAGPRALMSTVDDLGHRSTWVPGPYRMARRSDRDDRQPYPAGNRGNVEFLAEAEEDLGGENEPPERTKRGEPPENAVLKSEIVVRGDLVVPARMHGCTRPSGYSHPTLVAVRFGERSRAGPVVQDSVAEALGARAPRTARRPWEETGVPRLRRPASGPRCGKALGGNAGSGCPPSPTHLGNGLAQCRRAEVTAGNGYLTLGRFLSQQATSGCYPLNRRGATGRH